MELATLLAMVAGLLLYLVVGGVILRLLGLDE